MLIHLNLEKIWAVGLAQETSRTVFVNRLSCVVQHTNAAALRDQNPVPCGSLNQNGVHSDEIEKGRINTRVIFKKLKR